MKIIHFSPGEARRLLAGLKATLVVLDAFEAAGMRPEFDHDPRLPREDIDYAVRLLESELPAEVEGMV